MLKQSIGKCAAGCHWCGMAALFTCVLSQGVVSLFFAKLAGGSLEQFFNADFLRNACIALWSITAGIPIAIYTAMWSMRRELQIEHEADVRASKRYLERIRQYASTTLYHKVWDSICPAMSSTRSYARKLSDKILHRLQAYEMFFDDWQFDDVDVSPVRISLSSLCDSFKKYERHRMLLKRFVKDGDNTGIEVIGYAKLHEWLTEMSGVNVDCTERQHKAIGLARDLLREFDNIAAHDDNEICIYTEKAKLVYEANSLLAGLVMLVDDLSLVERQLSTSQQPVKV